MGKLSKEEMARRAGMEYAYRLVTEQGIEALEERLGRNKHSCMPCCLSKVELKEFCNNTKMAVVSSMAALTCQVLYDVYGFGHIRMRRFSDKFLSYCECIEGEWLSFEDCDQYIKEKTGVDIGLFRNEADILLNHKNL